MTTLAAPGAVGTLKMHPTRPAHGPSHNARPRLAQSFHHVCRRGSDGFRVESEGREVSETNMAEFAKCPWKFKTACDDKELCAIIGNNDGPALENLRPSRRAAAI